jgi:hypothetical protein
VRYCSECGKRCLETVAAKRISLVEPLSKCHGVRLVTEENNAVVIGNSPNDVRPSALMILPKMSQCPSRYYRLKARLETLLDLL